MRTTLELPDALFRELKARAALEGTSLKELLERLVRSGLAASDSAGIRRTPSRLPPPIRSGGWKMKSWTNAELAALADSLTDAKQGG